MDADSRAAAAVALETIHSGGEGGREQLVALVYDELRRMAAGMLRGERPGHTLQPTALVNEALLRLLGGEALTRSRDRRYLIGAAAQAMRQALVDHARARGAKKRGGSNHRVPLDDVLDVLEARGRDLTLLDEALAELAGVHDRPSQVVTLRFFGGLTVAEAADVLGVSESTVESDFRIARAWLRRRMGDDLR